MLWGEIINNNIAVIIIRVPRYRNLDGQNCFQCGMKQTVTYYGFQNVVLVGVPQNVALRKIDKL
jgi:hypothetical protein